jgi:acyl-CoA thioesterase-1
MKSLSVVLISAACLGAAACVKTTAPPLGFPVPATSTMFGQGMLSTDGGLARIVRALATHKPGIVILELGGNDGLRGLPVARVEANLGRLITKSRAAGAAVLLLSVSMPTNYGPQYTREFQQVYGDLGKRHDVGVGALMSPEFAVKLAYFQQDGIHPNAKAQPLLLDNVWALLTPLLRGG